MAILKRREGEKTQKRMAGIGVTPRSAAKHDTKGLNMQEFSPLGFRGNVALPTL